MRVLDVAVAAIIGVSAIAFMLYWNPAGFTSATNQHLEEASLRGVLLTAVSSKGIPWLGIASPEQVCVGLSAFSNSSVTVSAVIDGIPCGPGPASGSVCANLTVPLESRVVVLRAWADAWR